MNQSTAQTLTYSGNTSSLPSAPPRDPNLADRTKELLNHLVELNHIQSSTRAKLFGSGPQIEQGLGQSKEEPSIETMIAVACERAACLVGEAHSIFNRL